MFVYVRLIDSQEQQYPNEKPLIQRSRKTSNKIQKNQSRSNRDIQDPKKDRSKKTNVPENRTSFLNHSIKTNKNPDPKKTKIQASFESELKFVPPDEPCSFLVRFSTNFLTVPRLTLGTVSFHPCRNCSITESPKDAALRPFLFRT